MAFDLVVRGDLVLPDGVVEGGWVGIAGETVAAIGVGAPPRRGARR
jgi:allantoinase